MSIQAAALAARVSEPAARARAFVDEILIPREVAAERAGGRLPADDVALDQARGAGARAGRRPACRASTAARAGRMSSGSSSRSSSGGRPTPSPGMSRRAYNVLAHGTPAQIER